MKTLLITGGTGSFGKEFIKQTLSKQKDIQVIARDFNSAKGTMYLCNYLIK